MKYYNIEFENSDIVQDLRRLINQIWKLLPMRENQENWEKQLDSVLVELRGLSYMFGDQLNLLILISKLEGLHAAINFATYRVTVFSAISVLTTLVNTIDVRKS